MTDKHLHIISFDIPSPPNYGGVIDVYHKLRMLHKAGVKVILHCFEYGRERSKELKELCAEVHYYQRDMSARNFLSLSPFIIKSRSSEELNNRLLEDDYPILCEGLHTCAILNDARFAHRKIIYRESNIEHHYYGHLAKAERNPLKFLFFAQEALKLRLFQKTLRKADLMLAVSQSDTEYLQKHFPKQEVCYLPSFHENDEVISLEGSSDYMLYHGNLSVAENRLAAEYLIKNVMPHCRHKLVIAGLNPPASLKNLCDKHENVSLKANVPNAEMQELMQNAHIHILITFQATGLKLKLLNTLYQGRFCIANNEMTQGTGLRDACIIASGAKEIRKAIDECFEKDFSLHEIESRKLILQENYDNKLKINRLIDLIFNS